MTIYQAHKKAISMLKKAYPVESNKDWCVEISYYCTEYEWMKLRASFNFLKGVYKSVDCDNPDEFIAKLQEYIEQNPIAKED